LLLGLLRKDGGGAAHVLKGWFGADVEKVRSAVGFIRKPGDEPNPTTFMLSPHGQQIIKLGAEEAHRLNRPLVDTEYLLLGLLMEDVNSLKTSWKPL
jgi:Clp amino terminal domain, pathogenicity island component